MATRSEAPGSEPIEPFWKRLREISLYPAKSGSLLVIVPLALAQWLSLLPLAGWLIGIAIWLAAYKFGFECLRATANGRMEPPELLTPDSDGLAWRSVVVQLGMIVIGLAALVLGGPVVGIIVGLLVAFALPAALMSLAFDHSLRMALSPATWLAVVGRIGWPYAAVALLYFIFGASQGNAQALIVPRLPVWLGIPVYYFIAYYVIVATFHLMGYLVWQYHDELGFEPAAPVVRRDPATLDPDQSVIDAARALLRDGQPEAAADQLAEVLRTRGGTEAVHAQYRKLLAVTGRRDESLRHGREWITILLAQDRDRRALDVARECSELDPAFRPADADQIGRLAQKAADAGQSQLAVRLLGGFHRQYPKHADIPRNYLLAARLLTERLGQDAQARALLDQLLANYPNHPLREEIAAYRGFLDTLAKPRTPATR